MYHFNIAKSYHIISIFLLLLSTTTIAAKSNKNVDKAIITITSYDQDGKEIRTGNGFYIEQGGYALTTYDVFKNAYSAEVTDIKGKKCKVERICGANSLYNIVKFRTENTNATPLTLSANQLDKDAAVLIYSTNKKNPSVNTTITETSNIDSLKYYTLKEKVENIYAGSAVLNSHNEVIAILQTNQSDKNNNSYALDIAFQELLNPTGLAAANIALNSIHIAKELPKDEAQARTYIYMLTQNSNDSIIYLQALDDYISTYPQNSIGYTQKAIYWASVGKYDQADDIFNSGLETATEKSDIHYEKSKLIYRLNMLKNYQKYADWDMEKAEQEAVEAYNVQPLPLFTLQQADCQFALKKYTDAFQSYQKVNSSNISSPQTFAAAAITAELSKQDSTVIIALLDSAINRYGTPTPKGATVYVLQRASYLNKYKRYKEAARDYQLVEDLSGKQSLNDNFYYIKSICDTKARLYARALTDIEQALRLRPNDYDYTVEKALAQWRMGNYEEAIYAGQQALKINPQGADAYKAIGLALGEQGKKQDAIKNLNKAKELGDPQAEDLIQNIK